LFRPGSIAIAQSVHLRKDRPGRHCHAGASDLELAILGAEGLTLRQIAGHVGLGHETVRRRLLEGVGTV